MDKAFHDASNAVQHILNVIHSVKCATPGDAEKLREGAEEMVRRFSAAKAAYVAAKEGGVGGQPCGMYCAPDERAHHASCKYAAVGFDANGSEAGEVG